MPTSAVAEPRARILDAALRLMSEQGSAAASMRRLAAESGLNVATLYHYFPSKADLLRSVLEERHYGERLSAEAPPISRAAPAHQRLVELLRWIWESALEEEAVWRLLIGEALRGEALASTAAGELMAAVDEALARWIADLVPELPGDPIVSARIVRGQLFSLVVEHLAVAPVAPADAAVRAGELATSLLPQHGSTVRP